MAIQAQMYPENLGLQLMGGGLGSQDWLFMSNNNNNNMYNNLSNNTNNNNNMLYNGCGFNEFNLQQQKQQQQLQFQQQQQQQQQQQTLLQLQQQYLLQLQNQQQRNTCDNNINNNMNDDYTFMASSKNCTATTTTTTTASTTTSGSDYQMPMSFSFTQSFADQLEKQRIEMDRFITLQNERLKLALQEQRKQQLATIMKRLEEKAMELIRQKDDEISRAAIRRIELEEIIRKMEMENQEWQRLATENEAMVISLNNTLEQLKEQQAYSLPTSSSCSSNGVDDTESCCNIGNNNEEKWENRDVVLCKVCKTGKSCVLLLPCRHLCCCKACEVFVDVCPVCKSDKRASIEALIS